MSANDLIKEVAALPPQEQALFERLFREMKNGNGPSGPVRHSNWPDFGDRLRGIYGDKSAPDSQNIRARWPLTDYQWILTLGPLESLGC